MLWQATAAIIVAGLISSGVFSFGDKKDVIEDYFEAINDRDFDDYLNCFPAEIKAELKNDRDEANCSKEEYMNKLISVYEDDCGDNIVISFKFGKISELEEYNMDAYKAKYGSVPNISEAYAVALTETFNGSKGTKDEQCYCFVGKVRGKWKIFNFEFAGKITPDMKDSIIADEYFITKMIIKNGRTFRLKFARFFLLCIFFVYIYNSSGLLQADYLYRLRHSENSSDTKVVGSQNVLLAVLL